MTDLTALTALPAVPEDWTRALAIAAHPDDLEYGVAAAVARWTAGGRAVSYLLATRGEAGIAGTDPATCGPLREDEERRSAAVVGVTEVDFLGLRDGVLVEGLDLRRALARAIRRARPELVVTVNHHETWGPGAWNSADHRALGRSVIDAAGDAGNEWIFDELADEGLAPWSPRWVAVASSVHPTHTVDVTDTVERGIASLVEHRAYLSALDPRPVEEQAREILRGVTDAPGDRALLPFEVFG